MKLAEIFTLLKAGYSKAEIDAMRESETNAETSVETAEETHAETSGETNEETNMETDSPLPDVDSLQQTINELNETIKEMQRMNLQNARQPEIQEKTPLENASDILFESINK